MSLLKYGNRLSKLFRYSSCITKINNVNLKICYNGINTFNTRKSLIYSSKCYLHVGAKYDALPDASLAEELTENRAIINLFNCGRTSYKNSLEMRNLRLNKVWNEIKEKGLISIEVCNAYLQICIENHMDLDVKQFCKEINGEFDKNTFNLMLEAVCNKGDVKQAVMILEMMKEKGIALQEVIFNILLLGHTIEGGYAAGKLVLATMKSAQFPETINTHWAIIKGLAKRNNKFEFLKALDEVRDLPFDEKNFYEVLQILAYNNNHLWMKEFLDLIGKDSIPRSYYSEIEKLCLHLVHQNKPEAAFNYYKTFIEATFSGGYAKELMQEMLACKVPLETIINFSNDLVESSLNSDALYDVTEIALRQNLTAEALSLFQTLNVLRPHFFWPIILSEGRKNEELGVIEVMKKMIELNVQPDSETLEQYILKFCDISNVNRLVQKLQEMENLKMRDLVPPLLEVLLKDNKIIEAKNLCLNYSSYLILPVSIIKTLSIAWKKTLNTRDVILILQKICEINTNNQDWVGTFLIKTLRLCKSTEDYKMYLQLVKEVEYKKLRISAISSDFLFNHLNNRSPNCVDKKKIEAGIDKLFDIGKKDATQIQHPRDMNTEDLECHLIELTNKNMETRGVLRLLIQRHCRYHNFTRVEELRQLMNANNYEESAGMKSSLLHAYTLSENLGEAEKKYSELKQYDSNFQLDAFKVVDLATLLVKNDKLDRAVELLKSEAREARTIETFEKNCWKLLSAAKTLEQADTLFETLIKNKYCRRSNIILGPIVRIHMKSSALDAVNFYCKCAEEYKCTPLQLEMFFMVLEARDEELLNRVLEATAAVHGPIKTRMALISAFAEKGMKQPLTKFLSEVDFIDQKELKQRCKRWITENKVMPLLILKEASSRLTESKIDASILHLAIMTIYSNRNDCESAITFWKELEEEDIDVPESVNKELVDLLTRCKYEIPESLLRISN